MEFFRLYILPIITAAGVIAGIAAYAYWVPTMRQERRALESQRQAENATAADVGRLKASLGFKAETAALQKVEEEVSRLDAAAAEDRRQFNLLAQAYQRTAGVLDAELPAIHRQLERIALATAPAHGCQHPPPH